MVFIGIDPGKSGALAVIYNPNNIHLIPFSEESYIKAFNSITSVLGDDDIAFCVIEKVHAMPKQGVSSTFNFGMNFGWIKGCLESYRIPYQEVTPQVWKKEFGLTGDKTESVRVAQQLFPLCSLMRTDRSRKPDDGLAEALLMAEYGRRLMGKHGADI